MSLIERDWSRRASDLGDVVGYPVVSQASGGIDDLSPILWQCDWAASGLKAPLSIEVILNVATAILVMKV